MFPLIFSKTHNEKWWLVGLCAAVIVGIGIYWFMLDGIATAVGVMIVSVLGLGGVLPLSFCMVTGTMHFRRQSPDISREHMGAAGGLHSPWVFTIQNAFAFAASRPTLLPCKDLRPELRPAQRRSVHSPAIHRESGATLVYLQHHLTALMFAHLLEDPQRSFRHLFLPKLVTGNRSSEVEESGK